jgi:GntP family gluconate:H+ symporter
MSGGVILLITAAGGGFGQVLKETGITLWAGKLSPGGTPWSILLAFGVTSMIRIAQGSATVAMVTAVGVVQPLVAAGALGFHPVYLALAIGCGSKPIPWMNDSGFWLISRMGGLTEKETLRTASVMMTAMGVVGGLAVFLLAWVFPGV